MTRSDYEAINTIEATIVKRCFGLTKYHANTDLYDAIRLEPIEHIIKKSKIHFLESLLQNKTTGQIINSQINNLSQTSTRSFLIEIINLVRLYQTSITTNQLMTASALLVSQLNTTIKSRQNNESSNTIRYLLENNNSLNNMVLKKMLFWRNNKTSLSKRKYSHVG